MRATATNVRVGITFPSLLGLLFVGLKLTHFIDWQWKWILAPFWIPWAIVLPIFILFIILHFASGQHKTKRWGRK